MKLYTAEIRRLTKRRATKIFTGLMLVGLLLFALVLAMNSEKELTDAQIAEAQPIIEDNAERQAECIANPDDPEKGLWENASEEMSPRQIEENCQNWWPTDPHEVIHINTFNFENEAPGHIAGILAISGLVMMMLAATFIGAEWSSRGMSNIMLWHPNRWKVWLSKLGAVATVATILLVAFAGIGALLLWGVAAWKGQISSTNDWARYEEPYILLWRMFALSLGITLFGASVAMIGRNTAIAGGIIAVLMITASFIGPLVGYIFDMQYPELFGVTTWVSAWLTGEYHMWPNVYTGIEEPEGFTLRWPLAGTVLFGAIFALILWAGAAFKRRDVS